MAASAMVSLASSVHAGPGTFALLVSSGISVNAGVPSGWEMMVELIGRLARLRGEDAGDAPVSWYVGHAGGDPDYSDVLSELAPSPSDRRNLLSSYFEPTPQEREEGLKTPTRAHRAIAQLVAEGFVRVIVTTNFDRLLEKALTDVDVDPSVVSSPEHAAGALPIVHSRCTIIKVHGDYLSPDLKNTVDELAGYDESIDRLLDEVFGQYGLVVCGWSARWDTALRNAVLRSPSRRFATYWLHRGEVSAEAQEIIGHRGAIPVSIQDADPALGELLEKVQALAEAADQRPLDTAIAVARLKRYLPEPAQRIRLHDLVIGETDTVIEELRVLPTGGQIGPEQYAERMIVYERAAASLLKLLATGAYFSDTEDHDQLWVRCIERLANRTRQRTGKELLINLQEYPTLLALYALGLGALAADRIAPISRALGEVTTRDHRYPGPVGVVASSWHVLDADWVRRAFPELQRMMTPVSERLFGLLRPAIAELVSEVPYQEELFDKVEYLLGIAYMSQSDFDRGPATRAMWRLHLSDWSPRPDIQRHQQVLMAAGIFRDEQHLEQTCDAYDQYAEQNYHALRLR